MNDIADKLSDMTQTAGTPCPKCGGVGWCYGKNRVRVLCDCQLNEQRQMRRVLSNLPQFERRPLLKITKDFIDNYETIRDSGQNWIAYMGRSGSGKTTQAFMIVDSLLNRPDPVFAKVFFYSELVRELSSFRFDASEFDKRLDDTLEAEIIVLDDFLDVIPRPDSFEEQIALTLIKRRYVQRLPLVLTTEHTLQTLRTKMPVHGEAVAGRIYEMCNRRIDIALANAPNYRFSQR